MNTQKLKLTELKPYNKNARRNDQAVKDVAESIKQCGYISPIIVDENYEILAGHTRYKALKRLNFEDVDCVVATPLCMTEFLLGFFLFLDKLFNV